MCVYIVLYDFFSAAAAVAASLVSVLFCSGRILLKIQFYILLDRVLLLLLGSTIRQLLLFFLSCCLLSRSLFSAWNIVAVISMMSLLLLLLLLLLFFFLVTKNEKKTSASVAKFRKFIYVYQFVSNSFDAMYNVNYL